MAGSVTIPNKPPSSSSQDFTYLRKTGLEMIRKIAGKSWTDHNLHDPGITLLEAVAYAVTELGLKAGMPVSDLIESSKMNTPAEFFTAAQVLPVSPVTLADFRKILIDHPLLRNAWLSEVKAIPKGRYDVLLEYADDVLNSFRFVETITTAISQYMVEISFPHWDEPEAEPLRTNVDLVAAVFDTGAWSPIEGSDAWFIRVLLDYQPPLSTTALWVVVRVITPMANPAVELPLILQNTGTLILTLGDNSATDQTLLKRYQRRVIATDESTRVVETYLRDYRNLGEYFHEFRSVRLQEIAFGATIEVMPGIQVEELLADIFFAVDQMISPSVSFSSLDQVLSQSSDLVYDGPLLDNGFFPDAQRITDPLIDQLYTSDILRIIFQQGSQAKQDVQSRTMSGHTVRAVRDIRLANYLDGRSITTNARDCLRLVDSNRHIPRFSPEKCTVFFYRDGIEVTYDIDRVIQLFTEQRLALEAGAHPGSEDLPVPEGESFAVGDYYPVQNDLPLVYGVGEAGLPDHATGDRRARAKQLKGYLQLLEQILAGYCTQLEHLNDMFSSASQEETTVFQQPLYHLPLIQDILKAFNPALQTWQAFVNDASNAYVTALKRGESTDQFLDRRNRMLDHLLARLGEQMEDLAAQELRLASVIPGASSMTLSQLKAALQQRRQFALRRLLTAKSAFYKDLPVLQNRRLQAYGNVLWSNPSFAIYQHTTVGVNWRLLNIANQEVLEQFTIAEDIHVAHRQSALAMRLATQPSNYTIVPDGVQQRLELRLAGSMPAVARSVQTFLSVAAAQAAIVNFAQVFRQIWVAHAMTALERRLYHLIPVPSPHRRSLIHQLNAFFEILNDPAGGVMNEKIFRLWENPGFSGALFLQSEGNFPGATNAIAIANAEAGVREVIRYGISTDAYTIEGTIPALGVVLRDDANTIIARSSGVFTDADSAFDEIRRITAHLYLFYSMEGLYLIEHHTLFNPGGTPLSFPSAGKDPYSFQISIVLPSGYTRDFITPTKTLDLPQRFRDTEFRKHAERMIRQSCPAHILTRIFWVDRAASGVVLAGTEPCFDLFESRYLAWLEAYLTDQVSQATLNPLRIALTQSLSSIILDAETAP